MWETRSTGISGFHRWFSSTFVGSCKSLCYQRIFSFYHTRKEKASTWQNKSDKQFPLMNFVGLQWHDSIRFWKVSPWFQVSSWCSFALPYHFLLVRLLFFCKYFFFFVKLPSSRVLFFPLLSPITIKNYTSFLQLSNWTNSCSPLYDCNCFSFEFGAEAYN